MLSQEKDGAGKVVAYYSKKLTPAENYCVTRKELPAFVKSLDFFHPYLYDSSFIVRTVHDAWRWVKSEESKWGAGTLEKIS